MKIFFWYRHQVSGENIKELQEKGKAEYLLHRRFVFAMNAFPAFTFAMVRKESVFVTKISLEWLSELCSWILFLETKHFKCCKKLSTLYFQQNLFSFSHCQCTFVCPLMLDNGSSLLLNMIARNLLFVATVKPLFMSLLSVFLLCPFTYSNLSYFESFPHSMSFHKLAKTCLPILWN